MISTVIVPVWLIFMMVVTLGMLSGATPPRWTGVYVAATGWMAPFFLMMLGIR